MTSATHTTRIARPVEEVFGFLADGAANPRWQPAIVSTAPADHEVGLGAVFHQRARHPLGFTVPADYRVTAWAPPRMLALTVVAGGPLRPTTTYELSPAGPDATEVRCTVTLRPGGPGRLGRPLLGLLHPLFAWEAGWVERARGELEVA